MQVLDGAHCCLALKLFACQGPTFVAEAPQGVRMLLVLCQTCLTNTLS